MTPSPPAPPSPQTTLRLLVAATIGVLAVMLLVLWVIGQDLGWPPTVWLALPLILGVADLVLVPAVGSTVRPLPFGVDAAGARRIAANVLRTVTMLRLGLAEAPALLGLVASFATGSLVPYIIGLVFAIPLLMARVYPRASVVEAVRLRLESNGVSSHL